MRLTLHSVVVPAIIGAASDHAARRFLEFFAATIRNKNTRLSYYRAACQFFAWVEQQRIGELTNIEPIHVAAYFETPQEAAAKPTVKQHLAAINMLLDWMVVGQVLAVKPAHAMHGPKHVMRRGKTPMLTEDQVRRLLDSIDASTVAGSAAHGRGILSRRSSSIRAPIAGKSQATRNRVCFLPISFIE